MKLNFSIRFIVVLTIAVLTGLLVTGQQVFLVVNDRKTNEPLAFANVC